MALDQTFNALADPARLAVINLLREQPRHPSEMAETLELSRPTVSRHLKVLRQAGLIEADSLEPDARRRTYRLCREPFGDLRGWLTEVEAFWDEQLQAFKTHAERKYGSGS